jgi:hypothetical protein
LNDPLGNEERQRQAERVIEMLVEEDDDWRYEREYPDDEWSEDDWDQEYMDELEAWDPWTDEEGMKRD